VFFRAPEFVERACRATSLPEDAAAAVIEVARRIDADAALAALAWHCYWVVFHAGSDERDPPLLPVQDGVRLWPLLRTALGDDAGLFYLLVLLGGLPLAGQVHRRHDVPAQVARDTLRDVVRWGDEYRAEHGRWGLYPKRLTWLRHHFRGDLYHLVRLQFQFGSLWPGFTLYRHRQSGAVAAVSQEGALVAPTGQVVRSPVDLPGEDWERALAPGDPVLHLHIPAGSPMDFDQCGQSLREALRFFPRHFPERPFFAFACSSWLLDPTLAQLLPPESNIVRFQREVYLLPSRSNGNSTMERVFGRISTTRDEVESLPRDTTLRRAIVDHLLAGGGLGSGRCVLFPQDLDWGTQVYRRQDGSR
jgi:hypothetical protein